MTKVSRRQLARYAAKSLIAGEPVEQIAKNLAAALIASRRDKEADLLIQDIQWELENRGKLAAAHITSAHPLSEAVKDQLAKQLQQKLKTDQINLTTEVDSAIIGGLRIQTAKLTWDKTVANQLKQLKEVF